MQVDIRFFQATATAIPTLLIALAFTAKAFHPSDNDEGMWSPRSLKDVASISFQIALIASAEMISLAVLAINRPALGYVIVVGSLVALQLMMLWGSAISASIDRFRPKRKKHQNLMIAYSMGLLAMPFVAFFGILFTV